MASIGYGNLRCKVKGCNRVRPYWSDECKRHRELKPAESKQDNSRTKEEMK